MLFNEFTHEAAAALLAAKFSHARAHAKRKDNAERIVSLGAAALTLGRIFVAFTVLRSASKAALRRLPFLRGGSVGSSSLNPSSPSF